MYTSRADFQVTQQLKRMAFTGPQLTQQLRRMASIAYGRPAFHGKLTRP